MSLFQQAPTERWQVVTHPAALPGCCFLCRSDSTTREWFVDLSLQFEFHGAVYLCNLCLEEIARTVGWITPEVAQDLKTQVEEANRENYRLSVDNSAFHQIEQAIHEFNNARSNRPDGTDLGGDPRHPAFGFGSSVLSVVDRLDEAGPSAGESGVGAGEGTPPEPSDDSGMDVLRPDAGGDAAEFRLDI